MIDFKNGRMFILENMTEKQKIFCKEYLIDMNGSRAAIAAGYSEESSRAIASELLTKPNIQSYIQNLMDERSKRLDITADKVLNELASIGFSKIDDFGEVTVVPSALIPGAFEQTIRLKDTLSIPKDKIAAISSIKQGQCGIEIKLHDKIKALELLGKNLVLFTDKIDLTGSIDISLSDDIKDMGN